MNSMKFIACMVLFAAGAAVAADKPPKADPADKPAVRYKAAIIVFDLLCEQPEIGKDVAQSVRMRFTNNHEGEFYIVDRISTADISPPVGISADANTIADVMKNKAGCNIAIYGTFKKAGDSCTADIRCINQANPKQAGGWTKTFTFSGERARGEIARMIVEEITGQPEWVPPQYGDEPEPKAFGKPLNPNGDFEQGSTFWEPPDNCATFLEKAEGHGNVLRIRTDLPNDPWVEYHHNLIIGLADPAKPPTLPKDTSYGSVGGNEGVHYCSGWIKAEPGWRYWLTADAKFPGSGLKIFVKGFFEYADRADALPERTLVKLKLTPQQFANLPREQQKKMIAEDAKDHPEFYRRECYRWYMNCKGGPNAWTRNANPFPPRGGLPSNVQWLQIQVYAYWPAGVYYVDNVNLYKNPDQKEPIPEEAARTNSFEESRKLTRQDANNATTQK